MDASTTESNQRYFSPRRLGHANLWVSDYERAYDYYRNVIGFEHAYIQPDNQASFVSNGNTYHDYGLIDIRGRYAKPGQKPGLNHFALELRNEVELAEGYRRAKAAGVQFTSLQDHDVAHAVYQLDPDDNSVEIYADVVADWRAARSGVVIKEKPPYVPGESSAPIKEELYPKNPEVRVVKEVAVPPEEGGPCLPGHERLQRDAGFLHQGYWAGSFCRRRQQRLRHPAGLRQQRRSGSPPRAAEGRDRTASRGDRGAGRSRVG